MPLHLDSLTTQSITPEEFMDIAVSVLDQADDYYQPIDSLIHTRTYLKDQEYGDTIAHFVVSMYFNRKEGRNEILDVDMTLESIFPKTMQFYRKIGEASLASQQYSVSWPCFPDQTFWVETVNRFTEEPNLEGKKIEGSFSFFPKRVTLFENMMELNRAYGLPSEIQNPDLREIGLGSVGFSDDFLAVVEGLPKLFGTVNSVRDVKTQIGSLPLEFTLVRARTALGVLPVAMSRDVFDIDGIQKGSVLDMSGVLNFDFSKLNQFTVLRKEDN